MNMKNSKLLKVAALALLLSGPAYADSINANVSIGIPVGPPPAPHEEIVTVAPGPQGQYVWHKGHYRLIDSIYVWVPGHWVVRPTPAAVWVEPHWKQEHGRWMFVEGHW